MASTVAGVRLSGTAMWYQFAVVLSLLFSKFVLVLFVLVRF